MRSRGPPSLPWEEVAGVSHAGCVVLSKVFSFNDLRTAHADCCESPARALSRERENVLSQLFRWLSRDTSTSPVPSLYSIIE